MRRVLTIIFVMANLLISAQSQKNHLQVVASHSILADVVSNVAGNLADVSTLIPNGADPHTFQPTPRDLTRLANADLIVINGASFEEGLLDTIENVAADVQMVTVSSCVEMRSFTPDLAPVTDGAHDEIGTLSPQQTQCEAHHNTLDNLMTPHEINTIGQLHQLDCDEGSHDEHDEESHDRAVCDPHVWMLPQNVMLWTMLIRDTLIEADPQHDYDYHMNAENYLTQLATLEADVIQPMLDTIPRENRILVTNHDAFGYFADAYGFQIVSTIIPGGSTIAEPGPSSIVNIIEQINETGISAIFSETTISDTITRQIATETGAEIYVLYSGALSEPDGEASTYLDYMRYNVTTIASALTTD